MNILVTGAAGFAGRNLVENLKTLRDGRNRTHPGISVDGIMECDIHTTDEELDEYCGKADFVFNFAGVNRPKDPADFSKGNFGFALKLIDTLRRHGNKCPIMLASSVQATLAGRFGKSEYGLSKKAGEDLFFSYARETGVRVLVYRFPNLAGKWVRPNYNSAVGTFCHNIAHGLPIQINDPNTELELLFIDDLIEEMYNAMEGRESRCEYPASGSVIDGKKYDGLTPLWTDDGSFCAARNTHKATLGRIASLLEQFSNQPNTLFMPALPANSLEKKLYSMYLSYLPKEKSSYKLKMNIDDRGSFTEILKTSSHGQFSVNISKPGITKGQHWHNSKWELFIVVSGRGLIQQRKVGTDEIYEFEVNGENITAVYMLPGYTHNIINLSDKEDLVTLMWANEPFDPKKPDTFYEPVK